MQNHNSPQGTPRIGSSAVLGVIGIKSILARLWILGGAILHINIVCFFKLSFVIKKVLNRVLILWKPINQITIVGGIRVTRNANGDNPMTRMAYVSHKYSGGLGKTMIARKFPEHSAFGNQRESLAIVSDFKGAVWQRSEHMTPNDKSSPTAPTGGVERKEDSR